MIVVAGNRTSGVPARRAARRRRTLVTGGSEPRETISTSGVRGADATLPLIDAVEREERTYFSDEESFREGWKRPKWGVM